MNYEYANKTRLKNKLQTNTWIRFKSFVIQSKKYTALGKLMESRIHTRRSRIIIEIV